MKATIKQKLASRKLWAAVTAWLTTVLTAWGADGNAIARVTVIVSGVGALIVYILSEAYIDAKSAGDSVGYMFELGGDDCDDD